jgi:hypothetical protein
MMDDYYNSMDRELGTQSREMKSMDKAEAMGIPIEDFGTTTNPFEHQTNALKARIFHGANRVEFSFFGSGKGNKDQATPESFGKRDRLDMRELAEFNKVETTTHATVGIQGLSGLNMQQGMFSDDQRKQAMDEIKRAVHFAAEATTGGAIVFHTGEAPRYMHGRWQNGDGKTLFEMYPEEEKRKVTYLADPLTKRLVGQISNIDQIAAPTLKRDEKGNVEYLKDENGGYVVDKQLAEVDRIHEGKIPLYETDEEGNIKTRLMTFEEFKKQREQEYLKEHKRNPTEEEIAKDFFYQQKYVDVMYSLYFGIGNERQYTEALKSREALIKAKKFYEDLKSKTPEEEWWKYKKQINKTYAASLGLTPPDNVDPVEWLDDQIKDNSRNIAQYKELALHGRRTATEQLDQVRRSKLADQFAIEESAKSMGELGAYTWQMNEKAKRDYKEGKAPFKLKNDLYLAPENLFPEMYGSHPDELKNIVLKGRDAMKKELISKYGFKGREKEADALSKKHIKATFDIGHANIWRKYFKSKDGESLEERDKRFNNWLLDKTKQLVDEGIIGHIHVSDNFGFHDEHLAAGDGNAPIKEFIKQAKESGLNEFIVESGSFNAMTSLPDTWMHFDSPVYGLHVAGFTRDTWTDPSAVPRWNQFHRSYFGKTEGPRYLVGDMAPSEDFKGAPFYTGLGLE